jgi:hypothetical protein
MTEFFFFEFMVMIASLLYFCSFDALLVYH